MIGRTLSHYELVEELGRGGMGEVYLALDSRLSRRVALKILPPELAGSSQRRQSFEREARTLAALNHPNIVTVHSVEEADGIHFITMELVEGKALSYVIPPRGLPLKTFFDLAVPLADAVSAAHEHGVTHRDLKPANIMVSDAGRVKVLDFGLAKVRYDLDGSAASELSTQFRTEEGRIVGTVSYMSPEQAQGKAVDHRTDVFSLGIVLYEMLTGRHPFLDENPASTLSAILKDAPLSVSELNSEVSPELARVVRRCLSKEPGRRYQSCLDLRNELEEMKEERGAPSALRASTTAGPSRKRLSWVVMAAVMVAGLALAAFAVRTLRPGDPENDGTARFAIDLPPEAVGEALSLSPDGKHLAFIAANAEGVDSIWVRDLESGKTRALAGTENAWRIFWSPDSRFLGFVTPGQLKRIALSGGRPETSWDGQFWGGGTWHESGVVLVAHEGESYRVEATGGRPVPVQVEDAFSAETARSFPEFLPDGTHFLYVAAPEHEQGKVHIGSLDSERATFLMESESQAIFASGHVLFARNGALMGQRFDTGRLELVGQPHVIAPVMMSPAFQHEPEVPFSASENGILAFRGAGAVGQLVWFDADGRELGRVPQPPSGEYVNPSISPDGRLIAVNRRDAATGNADIWLIEVATNIASRFTSDPAPEMDLIWSPNGRRVVFSEYRDGRYRLWAKAVDGGEAELLWETTARKFGLYATDWSPDGKIVLCNRGFDDIWAVPVSGDQEPWVIFDSEFIESDARFSPDGRWIAYYSSESGSLEIYVQGFPDGKNKRRISMHGGTHPRWGQSGRDLYFWGGPNRVGTVMRVDVSSDPSGFHAGVPRAVFEHRFIGLFDSRNNFAVTPDEQRFLLRRPSLDPPPVTVIVNWTAELKGR